MQAAKLFANGRSQAVRLPAAFRFEGDTGISAEMKTAMWFYLPSLPIGRGLMPLPANWREKA